VRVRRDRCLLRLNPITDDDNAYVPRNSPAIGDLFEMFNFGRGEHEGDDGNENGRG